MVKSVPADEFLVSFLVDARGGYMQAQRMPQMKIFVPPDAAPAPTRIICHLLRPESVPNLPGMNDCDGFASRILQIHSSCSRFQKPILIEMPYIALLKKGDREIVILKKNVDSDAWKKHSNANTEETLKAEFGSLYESITPVDQLESNRICRIITTDIPTYFSLISQFQRDVNMIGPDGGFIESKTDKRIKLTFPQGALMKKIQIGLEVQNIDPGIINHVVGDNHKISLSPIITVEPKRRKFRDLIEIQMGLPKGVTKNDIQDLRLLFSISEYNTNWEDVTISTDLVLLENTNCMAHSTKISARVWLIYAPNVPNVSELANKIYALHCPTPYVGKFLSYARRHDQEECQIRCLLITDDTPDKTLECQESFELIATGPEVEVINKLQYQIECAGNIVAVTKSDESILFPVQSFVENRITLSIRVRNQDEPFHGKIAFIPHFQSLSKQIVKPITTLDIIVPEIIVDMIGSFRNPDKKHRVKNATLERIKGCQAIAKTELDLKSVADAVGADWRALAEELELEVDDINLVLNENCTDEEKAFMTLINWQTVHTSKATGNELNRALRQIGREDVVKSCMGDISFVEDEAEVKSAIEQLNNDDKKTHDECWDDILASKGKPSAYNESVDDSMIVETGDDWSESQRESKLSDISDDKSLVGESAHGSESEIKPLIDPYKAVTSIERTSSEKTAAFLVLVNQLDEVLPQPVILESSYNTDEQKEVIETSIVAGPLMSTMPSRLDIDLESISPTNAGSLVYAQPVVFDDDKIIAEYDYDTEKKDIKICYKNENQDIFKVDSSEIHSPRYPVSDKIVNEDWELLNQQNTNLEETEIINKEAIDEFEANINSNKKFECSIQTKVDREIDSERIKHFPDVGHDANGVLNQLMTDVVDQFIKHGLQSLDKESFEPCDDNVGTNTCIDENLNYPELHSTYQFTETEGEKIIENKRASESYCNDEFVNQTKVDNNPQFENEEEISVQPDNFVYDPIHAKFVTLNNDEALNQPEKHSVLHEVIESDPQIQTEVEEEIEVLPDGRIINRKITRRQISQTITEKVTRDIEPENEEIADSKLIFESPPEVVETEEELPDGTILKRKISTSVKKTSTTSKTVTEKEISKDENSTDSPAMRPNEASTENVSAKPTAKSRKNKNKKKSNKK